MNRDINILESPSCNSAGCGIDWFYAKLRSRPCSVVNAPVEPEDYQNVSGVTFSIIFLTIMETSTSITAKLIRWGNGDASAFDEIYPLIEPELKRLAKSMFRRFRPGETLRPTALLSEAYLRLSSQNRSVWKNRSHFYAIAATSMRRVVCNYHRDVNRKKRGGGALRISLSEVTGRQANRIDELIAVDEALSNIGEIDPRKVAIVEMRFFAGLTTAEIADALEISESTVNREWRMAKAMIYRMLSS